MDGALERGELAVRLYEVAVAAAATRGRRFRPIADSELRRLTLEAAAEVVKPTQFGARSLAQSRRAFPERLDIAQEAVFQLVDAMTVHAQSLKTYPLDLLGLRTLAFALKTPGFCPCWPFC